MTRIEKNYLYADIIISNFLVKDFLSYRLKHHKVKSPYKLASLFIKKQKIDIEQQIKLRQRQRHITCNELVNSADKWLEETIKIAHFNWLDD